MKTSEIYLAAGCFWGAQRFFDSLPGVQKTAVGYANGRTPDPTYHEVKSGKTGYAETVKISYDKSIISLEEILRLYFMIIDPTSLNKQGEDVGEQYRTGVYYSDPGDVPTITSVFLTVQQNLSAKMATELLPLENFYTAEEYHQKYLEKNPGGYCHISPKMIEFAKNYKPVTKNEK